MDPSHIASPIDSFLGDKLIDSRSIGGVCSLPSAALGLEMEYQSNREAAQSQPKLDFKPAVDGCVGNSTLILGSGMVVGPALEVIVASGVDVTLASNDVEGAEALLAAHASDLGVEGQTVKVRPSYWKGTPFDRGMDTVCYFSALTLCFTIVVGVCVTTQAVFLDMASPEDLPNLVSQHDLTISLLPASMHVEVAELCLDNGSFCVCVCLCVFTILI